MICVGENKNQIGGTRATRAVDALLRGLLADFGTEAEKERQAIQWVESLSPEEGDAVLQRARREWAELSTPHPCQPTGMRHSTLLFDTLPDPDTAIQNPLV
jgi:hypothetical protein